MADHNDDDGFQMSTTKKKNQVRLYVGGLPSETQDRTLREWLQSRLPEGVDLGAISIQSNNAKKSFALVECGGTKGINDILRILKQQDPLFAGHKLTIQREQRNNNSNSNGNSNNNNKARQRSGKNHTGKRNAGFRNKPGANAFSSGPSLTARGWSKPTTYEDEEEEMEQEIPPQTPVTSVEEASERIGGIVSKELAKATTVDDKINASIASTAATTMMTSLMASLGFQEPSPSSENEPAAAASTTSITDFASFAKGQAMQALLDDFGEEDPNWKQKIIADNDEPAVEATAPDFASFAKRQNMANLLEDFGKADPDWKNKIVDETADDEHDNNNDETTPSAANKPKIAAAAAKKFPSRLAIKGKAPIHLSIESFGFAHGAPSRKSRDRMGSPYTQPMGLLSVGDDITDSVPTYLEFHDGLRSGVIKRMLKNAPLAVEDTSRNADLLRYDKDEADDKHQDLSNYRDFHDYCCKYLAEQCIFPSLIEAIHDGGHGYVSPLTMTFQVGSYLGRHRSVVAVEWIAQYLRSLLRKNTNGKINCSVSVGTIHRDVGKRIPHKTYREDDEDHQDDKNDRV